LILHPRRPWAAALLWCAAVAVQAQPAAGPRIDTLTCEPNASVAHPPSRGTLRNNAWNAQAAGRWSSWKQCLRQRTLADGSVQWGWSWDWPNRDRLYAYPGITIGPSPWAAGPGTEAGFPRRVADIREMPVSYDLEIESAGKYNLAAEMWLIRAPRVPTPPDPSLIAAELMIWTDVSAGVPPDAKRKLGEVVIDGQAWVVYHAPDWGDGSGGSPHRWSLISYHARPAARAIRYDARKILADAVRRGLIGDDLYVANFELGNEIISGSGSTWLRHFSVELR
jgi:hypothetical protein